MARKQTSSLIIKHIELYHKINEIVTMDKDSQMREAIGSIFQS